MLRAVPRSKPTGLRPRRVRVRVSGTVQGVGFRPFVYRLAERLGLSGWVLNDSRGVVIEAEGASEAVAELLGRLSAEAPPLAEVERVLAEELEPLGGDGFAIVESEQAGQAQAPVAPDAATCDACLAELFDPGDRRHRYPFINCTECGPRFTIVRGVPYDRPLTTMAGFEMCERCREEYERPLDRRFHAQPNACPECGPRARLVDRDGAEAAPGGGLDAVAAAAAMLLEGQILAVKGLGGYHLACRADDERAVAELRSRKRREEKPFALMAPDLETCRALAELGAEEEALLAGRERPIVLCPRRGDAAVAAAVAPRSPELGLMLPYSPLHHLLLADAATTLVMTSGNVADEPIAYRDEEALPQLGAIADFFLVHDRPIETRTDDSVLRVAALGERRRPLMLRRSRGFVPRAVTLPLAAPRPLLACGAELKNAFCLAKGDRAWVGHHIGDLKNYETLQSFSEGVRHFESLFAVEPAICAHDLHPDYLSSRYAGERDRVQLVGVQHHHAHLAACLAEHGRRGPAVGAVYDGTGYGNDGTVWGGEILFGDLRGFDRVGRLWALPMPGGEAAIREPWRMAAAWLAAALGAEAPIPPRLAGAVEPQAWRFAQRLAASGMASPLTTSAGRLFDAVAAICGICARVSYEGQAAIELEAACDRREGGAYAIGALSPRLSRAPEGLEAGVGELAPGGTVLDPRQALLAALRDLEQGVDTGVVAARFHNGLAAATARVCCEQAEARGCGEVVLSGGVFQNRRLLERTASLLSAAGLRALVPERLPPGDGGIAYGQAAVAAARAAAGGGWG